MNPYTPSISVYSSFLAFSAYKPPSPTSSRWEVGNDLSVAFVSPSFTASIYSGVLELRVLGVGDLPPKSLSANAIEEAVKVLSGGAGVDAYVLAGVLEKSEAAAEDFKLIDGKNSGGVTELKTLRHSSRTETAWANKRAAKVASKEPSISSKSSSTIYTPSTGGFLGLNQLPPSALFLNPPSQFFHVHSPSSSYLVLSLYDEDVLSADALISSSSVALKDLLTEDKLVSGETVKRKLKMTSKPPVESQGSAVIGAAVGAAMAGPAGAVAGGLVGRGIKEGSGKVDGNVEVEVRWIPIDRENKENGEEEEETAEAVEASRTTATEDLDWSGMLLHTGEEFPDMELCAYLTHSKTGCVATLYRSLESKTVAVSFRGTAAPLDLLVDVKIAQDSWIEGEDVADKRTMKVHTGFRESLDSVSRRLKELVLAATDFEPEEYNLLVTGHSLGGALATLFVADVAEFGVDSGRGLPSLDKSEPWFQRITAFFASADDLGKAKLGKPREPPRFKTVDLYSFGSPRVGNAAFCENFETLVKDRKIAAAYRVVNGADMVARLPRTVDGMVLGSVGYEHCGMTVLISPSDDDPTCWIEGASEGDCPVRDGVLLASPMRRGSVLGDVMDLVKGGGGEAGEEEEGERGEEEKGEGKETENKTENKTATATTEATAKALKAAESVRKIFDGVSGRLSSVESLFEVAEIIGIDRRAAEREVAMVQSLADGSGLLHHLEPDYYRALNRMVGRKAEDGTGTEKAEQVKGADLNV